MQEDKTHTIDLRNHKVYIESLKTEMVPYSVAAQAVEQMAESQTKKYIGDLQHAMNELHKSITEIQDI